MRPTTVLFRAATRPRHLLSIGDVTAKEFTRLVLNAASHKTSIKSGKPAPGIRGSLAGKTVAMMFSKRSTRTRVSTEAAIAAMGGHAMFLGKDDIQLGVNETVVDTSRVISSMTSCMVARVGPHSDVVGLANESSVPVINALSDAFHPLQIIADFLTLHEAIPAEATEASLGLEGTKLAWVGDSNNVLIDLAIACAKMGVDISVASPQGYGVPDWAKAVIRKAAADTTSPGRFTETTAPEEAIKDADVLVTDTWVSMGQEDEAKQRLKDFSGYRITEELARRGGAKPHWKFMHCLPRHPEEVDDAVFYGSRSLVFQEAENRLWAALSALEAFVVNKGHIA